jgi:hypothetical protein
MREIMKFGFNIKKLLVTTMLFVGITTFAQDGDGLNLSNDGYDGGFRLGFGLNGLAATGDYYNWGLGGDVRLQYDLNRRYSLTLTTGYTHLFAEEEDFVDDLGYIPAKLGFKAFVWEDSFYVLGEIGAAFAVTNDVDETAFLWSPGIGYANKNFDLSLRYQALDDFDTNQIALRLAYGFKI